MKVVLYKNIDSEPDFPVEIEKVLNSYEAGDDRYLADARFVAYAERLKDCFKIVTIPDDNTDWKVWREEDGETILIYVVNGKMEIVC